MRSIIRATRLVAVAALVITVAIGFGSPAGAVSTGSVVNNGAGGVTVTYAVTQGDMVALHVYTALTPCATGPSLPPAPDYYLLSGQPQPPSLGASPATVNGTTSVGAQGGTTTIPTGTYMFCLYSENNMVYTLISSVQTTIGTVTPTTTSPSSSTSTSTDPAADPVAPAFTG